MSTHIAEVPEWDELHYVPNRLFSSVGAEHTTVSIQELHCCKVGVAHSDYNDGHGQFGSLYYRMACLIHVTDHAISNNQQREVLL